MKTVILCIDRDDDLGVKGGVEGPIIGREENIRAALALGLADPEDADTNTVLAAIKLYDRMVKDGENVEVVTICGDADVGYKSDRALMRQLEEVMEVVNPNNAILVSNGAEDEFIFPMVSSRLKIDHVHDVYVKQSKELENWYYYIVKAARDTKLRTKIIAPISLAFILVGLFYLYPAIAYMWNGSGSLGSVTSYALPTLSVLIGVYILWRTYSVGDAIVIGAKKTRDSVYEGDLSLIFYIGTIMLTATGVANGIDDATSSLDPQYEGWFTRSIMFLSAGALWFGAAAAVLESRKAVNAVVMRDNIPPTFWGVIISIVGLTFLSVAAMNYLERLIGLPNAPADQDMFIQIVIGLSVLVIGYVLQRRSKPDLGTVRDRWRR
jgi:putative membrane protein